MSEAADKRIWLLKGDYSRCADMAAEIRRKFVADGGAFVTLESATTAASELSSTTLFCDSKLAQVDAALLDKEWCDVLEGVGPRIPTGCALIIREITGPLSAVASKRLAKMDGFLRVVDLPTCGERDTAMAYARECFGRSGKQIDLEALQLFTEVVGYDCGSISSEVSKLALVTGDTVVSADIVAYAFPGDTEAQYLDFYWALKNGNPSEALLTMETLLRGEDFEPTIVVASLQKIVRTALAGLQDMPPPAKHPLNARWWKGEEPAKPKPEKTSNFMRQIASAVLRNAGAPALLETHRLLIDMITLSRHGDANVRPTIEKCIAKLCGVKA